MWADISYDVSVVSRYMHDPRKEHLEIVYRILRYLKSSPGKGIIFIIRSHLNVEGEKPSGQYLGLIVMSL
jgi:hypothetical protein